MNYMKEQPNAVCFHLRGYSVNHKDVYDAFRPLLALFPEIKIVSLQFFPMKLHFRSVHVDNRWVIRMDCIRSREHICGMQIKLGENEIFLKRYEDALETEKKRLNRKSNLLGLANAKA